MSLGRGLECSRVQGGGLVESCRIGHVPERVMSRVGICEEASGGIRHQSFCRRYVSGQTESTGDT